jgi:hypothetical protein
MPILASSVTSASVLAKGLVKDADTVFPAHDVFPFAVGAKDDTMESIRSALARDVQSLELK